jgi:nucleotide-binding universal stress UspA family protein
MTASPIKALASIACVIRVGEEIPQSALQQAIKLAAAHNTHLTVTIATQQLATPYSPIWMSLSSALVNDLNAKTKAKADEAADTARTALRIAGVTADVHVALDTVGVVAEQAVRAARASDLIVVDQPDTVMDTKSTVLEEALFRSGRPILVATPKREPIGAISKAMLAWDGTSHAARAAADLLALSPSLKQVDIVSVLGEKDLSSSLPGADFARHVARKGVFANLVELSAAAGPVARLLDDYATSSGADVITMGGFGHSRLRQFVLGGVTVTMIQTAASPLFMSY